MFSDNVKDNIIMDSFKANSGITVQPNEQSALSKWELSNNDILSDFAHNLIGEARVDGVWKKTGTPFLNVEGVLRVTSMLAPMCSKNTILGDYDEREIHRICFYFATNAATMLAQNMRKFEIDRSNYLGLCGLIDDFAFASLKRAQGGKERELHSGTKRVTEVVTPQNKQEETGFRKLLSLTG